MKKLIQFLQIISNKIDNIKYLLSILKWMASKYLEPRPIGTVFTKQKGNQIITYEIIGHISGLFKKEIFKEIDRQDINGDKCE